MYSNSSVAQALYQHFKFAHVSLTSKVVVVNDQFDPESLEKASRVSASVIPILYVPDTILPTVVTKTSKYFLSLLRSYFMD